MNQKQFEQLRKENSLNTLMILGVIGIASGNFWLIVLGTIILGVGLVQYLRGEK